MSSENNRAIAQGLSDAALTASLIGLAGLTAEDMPPPLATGQQRLDAMRADFQAEADLRALVAFPWSCGCGEQHRTETNALDCRKCRAYLSPEDYAARKPRRSS